METLQISAANAQTAFKNADAAGKKLLTDLIGEKVLNPKITDRVKSFKDACEVLGIDPDAAIQPYTELQKNNFGRIQARHHQDIICEALNEGWEPDWRDPNQPKFYAWITLAVSGFSFDDCGCDCTYSYVGSRLFFKTKELAEYFGKHFIELHNRAL